MRGCGARALSGGATRRLALAALAMLAAACAGPEEAPKLAFDRPETTVDYEVTLNGVGDEKVRELMTASLSLYRLQDKGAHSLAFLRRRALADVDTALKILRSRGYYGAEVDVSVAEGPPAAVALDVSEGPLYTLMRHDLNIAAEDEPPRLDMAALGSPVGRAPRAQRILNAETAAVDHLKADGWVYAERTGRDAVADPEAATLEVETAIDAGRRHVFGGATFEGLERVRQDYVETYLTFREGEIANREKLVEFQRALIATRLFDAAVAELPETPPASGPAPVTVRLSEAPARTVTAGLRYDTDAGPAARGGFEHRNLFGANETGSVAALIGLNEQSVDFGYRKPQFRRSGQDLVFGLGLQRTEDQAFQTIGAVATAGLERELTPALTIGAGGLLELSRTDDDGVRETATLVGLPVFATYDDTDDLLNPSRGFRAQIRATPFAGMIGGAPVSFGIVDGSVSTYFDLTGRQRHIFAVRGRLAFAPAGDVDVVAANRRLYSGGGGSVRGYRERFIGPLDADGDPVGGLSAVEAGAEIRSRVTGDFGVAAFVEAGSVSTSVYPDLDNGVRVAAGLGFRYYSPIGPVRADVGVPLNPRSVDDSFQIYVSLGQAF